MKKRLVALWLVMLILPSCVTATYANEGYALSDQNFMPDHIYGLLSIKFQIAGETKPVFILDHDPTQGNVEYVSWLPYDTLAEISLGWKTASVIVFNTTMNAYFLRVSYMPTISTDGQLKYCALGTSNGFCYGSRATEKGDTNITTNVTINQGSSVPNRYVSTTLINTAKKTAEDITKGLVNIMEWLDVIVDGILLTIKQIDLTNDLLYWIADNFNDMLYAIGKANLLNAEIGLTQLQELVRLEDFLSAINYNQIYSYYAQNSFFADVLNRLDSVISNGVVQVNTTPLEARLDKMISMYSKVNSVVLDTAAVNGGQITDAVGGELRNAIFWGDASKANNTFVFSDGVRYILNVARYEINGLTLRSVNLGPTIPSYIANDPMMSSGVWRKGTDYILSDTYNASTGEYVQRVGYLDLGSLAFLGKADWGAGFTFFYTANPVSDLGLVTGASIDSDGLAVTSFLVSSSDCPDLSIGTYSNGYLYIRYDSVADCAALSTALSGVHLLYPLASSKFLSVPTATISIPDGGSYISAYYLRITGSYETYDSYTQTSDIIAAINNIPPYDDSGLIAAINDLHGSGIGGDLTAVTSRMDAILAELQSTSGSASCEHTYTQHMEQEADCTLPGLMISTCSKCGDSYSEIVDPLGHDWVVSSHVDAVTDPDTGEETASAYDVYTCSRCERTYEDHTGDGAPDEDYSDTTISKLVVKVFSKLGTFAGKLIGFFVHLLDKALTSVDNVISKFNDYTAQISGFGGSYTTWLTGFWGIIPAELQIALTFSVICMALGAVGKKLLFS